MLLLAVSGSGMVNPDQYGSAAW